MRGRYSCIPSHSRSVITLAKATVQANRN